MTDQSYTHISMLLDRSGSMHSIASDIEGGFNDFVHTQTEQPGRATMTLAQFDDRYELVHDFADLDAVGPLSLRPRGSTALLDSIARLIHDTGAALEALDEDQRPGTVIFGIMTDGLENASREYTHAAIRTMITTQTEKFSWEFLYMGANQDAIEVGGGLGIAADRSLTYDTAASSQAMAATSTLVSGIRSGSATGYTASTTE